MVNFKKENIVKNVPLLFIIVNLKLILFVVTYTTQIYLNGRKYFNAGVCHVTNRE